MCGRYTLMLSWEELHEAFSIISSPPVDLPPRYNAAPSQSLAVVANHPGPRQLELFRWGLVPAWAKDTAIGNKMINSRAETVAEKPAFGRLLKAKRCIVLADGFYEWRGVGKKKQPIHFHLKDRAPFAFAGLWDEWTDHGTGEVIRSFSIITTTPNLLVAPVHDRMPVILPRDAVDTWLSPEKLEPDMLLPLLSPYPAEEMEATSASTLVGSPSNEGPELLQPERTLL